MASIAAGKYCGVASKANVVMVKNYYWSNWQTYPFDELAEIHLRTTQHCLEWIWQDIEANNLQGKAVILSAQGKQLESRKPEKEIFIESLHPQNKNNNYINAAPLLLC